jgi:hypothetical protein
LARTRPPTRLPPCRRGRRLRRAPARAPPPRRRALPAGKTRTRRWSATSPRRWLTVYDDFIRTKKQCGEATDGLTFEKFSHTLKKNRDQLIARHGCKKVKFSVYVKEGRASLKATPIKE